MIRTHADLALVFSGPPDKLAGREDQKMKLKALILAAGAACLATVNLAKAQAWPSRPITFIVSQAAGSSPDVMARLMASKLEPLLGQSIIIDNKPGAGNVIGAQAAAQAAPDGYKFFFATSAALANNVYMLKKLPYDPVRDFTPVALVTRSHQMIVVNKDLPAHNLAELIAIEKKEPGKLSIAVDGPRNLAGVTAQALNLKAGIKMVLVPYANINTGIQDTMAGRAEVGIFSISIIEEHVKSGALRALAIAASRRMDGEASVPSAAETIPGFDFAGWFMLMAPAGTSPDIVKKLNAAVDQALKDPQVREMAPKLGYELNKAGVGTPEDAGAFLKAQLDFWGKTTKELGIEPE